ncbi:universal stress protein [Penaeicola halotolerans]|uniref:universal stress protein n=1 Tax=Penaeicola halotolerans TaxID=2793196 RepID=UPI001CF8AF42|nr:universal stress protein [Penaeicola halotolerans]
MFQKIALAVAFSPRIEALLAEARRLRIRFDAELILIHIGEKSAELEDKLDALLVKHQFDKSRVKIFWEEGKPAKQILHICKQEKVDLLIAGALKKEGLLEYYIGSIARKIIRKADCSVMMLIEPSVEEKPFERIVINGTQLNQTPQVIASGLAVAQRLDAQVIHILNEIKMYGLQMATASEGCEDEVSQARKQLVNEEIKYVEDILKNIDKGTLKINIKVTSGKWAPELVKFSEKINANLIILGHEKLGFFDRLFPHDLEDILQNLPSNILFLRS